ncbi:hypothetical protein F5Y16DRAFT_335123 [Xylariaceae sp. FL0255]|nr:hypothetical protein F5Y16DRAFT_335123 [Xylariaceae sp. FL0255]
MQLTSIVATALLPLLALGQTTSTMTSTMTMTKTITISQVSQTSYVTNTTASYSPMGTGHFTVPVSTTPGSGSSPTTSSPTVSPTIDNTGGAGTLSAYAFAGVAGMVLAALL